MKFKTFARTALAAAVVFGAQFASAQVVDGSFISFKDGEGASPGGAFKGTQWSNASQTTPIGTFESFCLEKTEYINFTSTFYVKTVTTSAVGSYGTDPIGFNTAWLFTQFYNNGKFDLEASIYSGFSSAKTKADENTALQLAFWKLEGEISDTGSTFADYLIGQANAAGWTNTGSVKVLNLYKDANYTQHAQDQLYIANAVPEPETYAMMLAGLGLMGAIARRRKLAAQA